MTSTTLLQRPSTAPTRTFVPLSCHKCGADLSHSHDDVTQDAQHRISELETQVRILTDKATAAVDKLADYEDELRQLKASSNQHPANKMNPTAESLPIPHNTPQVQDPPLSIVNARSPLQSRLSSLLPSRRATSQPPSSAPPHQHSHDPQNTTDLLTALTREQHLRQVAESRISQTNDELEELSAQLFQEANEMVATERKARAKLEERVALLERRDGEKRKRLEVLEGRMGRIERVRELLKEEES